MKIEEGVEQEQVSGRKPGPVSTAGPVVDLTEEEPEQERPVPEKPAEEPEKALVGEELRDKEEPAKETVEETEAVGKIPTE